MSREDKTRSEGMGRMTGWCRGFCAGCDLPCPMNPAGWRPGFGFRWMRGRRSDWWRQPSAFAGGAAYSKTREKEDLRNQIKMMEEQMAALRERLEELETDSTGES